MNFAHSHPSLSGLLPTISGVNGTLDDETIYLSCLFKDSGSVIAISERR